MGFSGALIAMATVQGVSQITQGYAQKQEANFNATVLDNKANLIDAQSSIEEGQYQQLKGKYLSKSTANIGKAGIMPQGSALAVMLETQRQIEIDQALSKFNFEQEKSYTKAQANQQRRSGKQAMYTGYTNAFTTALQGVSNYAMYNMKTDTTFDSINRSTGFKQGRM